MTEQLTATKLITSLLGLSSDLITKIKDRKITEEMGRIHQLILQLQALQSSLLEENTKLHTENSKLTTKISKLEIKESQTQAKISDIQRQQQDFQREIDERKDFKRKVTKEGVLYMQHASEVGVYACAICFNQERHIPYLQPAQVLLHS